MSLWNVALHWPNGTTNSRPVIADTAKDAVDIYSEQHGIHSEEDAEAQGVTVTCKQVHDPDGRTEALLAERI